MWNPETDLIPGKNYRVMVHPEHAGNRVPQQSVMTYVGYSDKRGQQILTFSLRPLAGTQTIPLKHIVEAIETDEEVRLPTRVKNWQKIRGNMGLGPKRKR